jgi:hypothetical protein
LAAVKLHLVREVDGRDLAGQVDRRPVLDTALVGGRSIGPKPAPGPAAASRYRRSGMPGCGSVCVAPAGDARSLSHRRADALVEVCHLALSTDRLPDEPLSRTVTWPTPARS